jgi:hypothetical protein
MGSAKNSARQPKGIGPIGPTGPYAPYGSYAIRPRGRFFFGIGLPMPPMPLTPTVFRKRAGATQ